jgi:hypothetical protein
VKRRGRRSPALDPMCKIEEAVAKQVPAVPSLFPPFFMLFSESSIF